MKKYCIVFIMSAVLVFPATVFSQYYLPVGLMPMEYNSSFAGSAGNARISSNMSFAHNNNEQREYNGYGLHASYDKYLPKLRSGIGIVASELTSTSIYKFDWNPLQKYRLSNISLAIAPKISIKGKYTISPSIDLSYYHSESIIKDPIRQFSINNGFSSAASILFNASNYYIGYMARIYQSESNSYYSYYGEFDFYSAFQFGYSFQKNIDSKFSFTPQFVFPMVANSNSIEWYWPAYNLSFRYNHFIISAINQFNISYPIGFQLGWQKNGWRVLVSNEFKDIYREDQYTAHLSMRYIFNQDKKSIHILNTY